MIRVGLTGSVGMGKSTAAAHFARQGDAVFDADRAVHTLYEGAAVGPVGERFPDAVRKGVIDRKALAGLVLDDPKAMADLEAIVHPLVRGAEREAVSAAQQAGRKIIVLDIPLLFETGREGDLDAVVVVSAPPEVQRERVLARPGMTEDKLRAILKKQMPDAQKRARAHFVIDTSGSVADGARQVQAVRRALLALQ